MPEKPENRVERIVNDLLRGRRLRLRTGDAEEKEAITAAARFAAAGQGPQRMSPVFRRRLAQTLESAPKDAWMTRRAALVAGLGVAAGAHGRWTDVGALLDFAEGAGTRVKAGAVGAFVFRRGDTVTAVSSICSHLPCELWWDATPSVLQCPCHPAAFESDGKPAGQAYGLQALNEVKVRVTAARRVEVLGT